MPSAASNYALNLFHLLRREQLLRPLIVTYYVTTWCNLNCTYCEDFGARRNATALPPLALEECLQILRVVRGATDQVMLTGGEPLLHPQIDEMAARAHQDLGLKLTLLTNGSLLHEHEAILPHLRRVLISLDSTDPAFWSEILQAPAKMASRILENIRTYAGLQKKFSYQLIVNCVLTPETLPGARAILAFCKENQILVSFSPQAVMNWPNYDLLISQDYKAFLAELLVEKQRGGPILGSIAYLRTLFDFQPYACYPTLVPRILPNGDLSYPCRPIEKDDKGHGGRPANLLQVRDWNEAIARAVDAYGQPPQLCSSCFQQCFAEPSLMQSRPLDWLSEWLRYPTSRSAGLTTFAPGS